MGGEKVEVVAEYSEVPRYNDAQLAKEVFPLVDKRLLPLGNFHMVTSPYFNRSAPNAYYFSDGAQLIPAERAVDLPYPGAVEFDAPSDIIDTLDTLIAAGNELSGDLSSEGITTKVLQAATKHVEALKGLDLPRQSLSALSRALILTESQERVKLAKWAEVLDKIAQIDDDLWVIGRYHENGKIPTWPRLRDASFAAKVAGFHYDADRGLIIPYVLNSFGTQIGLLPPNITLRNEAKSWLFLCNEEYEKTPVFNNHPQLDGVVFDTSDVGLRL